MFDYEDDIVWQYALYEFVAGDDEYDDEETLELTFEITIECDDEE